MALLAAREAATMYVGGGGKSLIACAEKGLLIRRALDLICALKLGVRISLDDIRADELAAMLIIAEERDWLKRERPQGSGNRGN